MLGSAAYSAVSRPLVTAEYGRARMLSMISFAKAVAWMRSRPNAMYRNPIVAVYASAVSDPKITTIATTVSTIVEPLLAVHRAEPARQHSSGHLNLSDRNLFRLGVGSPGMRLRPLNSERAARRPPFMGASSVYQEPPRTGGQGRVTRAGCT